MRIYNYGGVNNILEIAGVIVGSVIGVVVFLVIIVVILVVMLVYVVPHYGRYRANVKVKYTTKDRGKHF